MAGSDKKRPDLLDGIGFADWGTARLEDTISGLPGDVREVTRPGFTSALSNAAQAADADVSKASIVPEEIDFDGLAYEASRHGAEPTIAVPPSFKDVEQPVDDDVASDQQEQIPDNPPDRAKYLLENAEIKGSPVHTLMPHFPELFHLSPPQLRTRGLCLLSFGFANDAISNLSYVKSFLPNHAVLFPPFSSVAADSTVLNIVLDLGSAASLAARFSGHTNDSFFFKHNDEDVYLHAHSSGVSIVSPVLFGDDLAPRTKDKEDNNVIFPKSIDEIHESRVNEGVAFVGSLRLLINSSNDLLCCHQSLAQFAETHALLLEMYGNEIVFRGNSADDIQRFLDDVELYAQDLGINFVPKLVYEYFEYDDEGIFSGPALLALRDLPDEDSLENVSVALEYYSGDKCALNPAAFVARESELGIVGSSLNLAGVTGSLMCISGPKGVGKNELLFQSFPNPDARLILDKSANFRALSSFVEQLEQMLIGEDVETSSLRRIKSATALVSSVQFDPELWANSVHAALEKLSDKLQKDNRGSPHPRSKVICIHRLENASKQEFEAINLLLTRASYNSNALRHIVIAVTCKSYDLDANLSEPIVNEAIDDEAVMRSAETVAVEAVTIAVDAAGAETMLVNALDSATVAVDAPTIAVDPELESEDEVEPGAGSVGETKEFNIESEIEKLLADLFGSMDRGARLKLGPMRISNSSQLANFILGRFLTLEDAVDFASARVVNLEALVEFIFASIAQRSDAGIFVSPADLVNIIDYLFSSGALIFDDELKRVIYDPSRNLYVSTLDIDPKRRCEEEFLAFSEDEKRVFAVIALVPEALPDELAVQLFDQLVIPVENFGIYRERLIVKGVFDSDENLAPAWASFWSRYELRDSQVLADVRKALVMNFGPAYNRGEVSALLIFDLVHASDTPAAALPYALNAADQAFSICDYEKAFFCARLFIDSAFFNQDDAFTAYMIAANALMFLNRFDELGEYLSALEDMSDLSDEQSMLFLKFLLDSSYLNLLFVEDSSDSGDELEIAVGRYEHALISAAKIMATTDLAANLRAQAMMNHHTARALCMRLKTGTFNIPAQGAFYRIPGHEMPGSVSGADVRSHALGGAICANKALNALQTADSIFDYQLVYMSIANTQLMAELCMMLVESFVGDCSDLDLLIAMRRHPQATEIIKYFQAAERFSAETAELLSAIQAGEDPIVDKFRAKVTSLRAKFALLNASEELLDTLRSATSLSEDNEKLSDDLRSSCVAAVRLYPDLPGIELICEKNFDFASAVYSEAPNDINLAFDYMEACTLQAQNVMLLDPLSAQRYLKSVSNLLKDKGEEMKAIDERRLADLLAEHYFVASLLADAYGTMLDTAKSEVQSKRADVEASQRLVDEGGGAAVLSMQKIELADLEFALARLEALDDPQEELKDCRMRSTMLLTQVEVIRNMPVKPGDSASDIEKALYSGDVDRPVLDLSSFVKLGLKPKFDHFAQIFA